MAKDRYYDIPAHERDVIIKNMHRQRYSLRDIGCMVGMSPSGVLRALERMADGRPGRDSRG